MRILVAGGMLGLALGIAASIGCNGPTAFACSSSEECQAGGEPGQCEPSGFCSYPDPGCESGRRYGGFAGPLSEQCVEPGQGTDTAAGTSAGSSSGPAETTGDHGSTGGVTTITTGPSASSSTGSDGGPTDEVFTDDELAGEFELGTFEGTVYDQGGVALVAGTDEGAFVSRIYQAAAPTDWTSLVWTPAAPYGKPLPSSGGVEAGYVEGNADMTDNVLLLRFEEPGPLGDGDVLQDSSGHANHGRVVLADADTVLELEPGRYGQAINDSDLSYVSVPMSDDFQFGSDDFTWALWMRSTADCEGLDVSNNQVYLGIDDEGADRTHIWFGCTRSVASACDDVLGLSAGRAGGTFRSVHSLADGASYCGTTPIADGQWHHMVVAKQGHPDATISLFVDGQLEDEVDASFAEPIGFLDEPDIGIGAFSGGTFQADVTLDEVAVWRRALGAQEVFDQYVRGAVRLQLQVRACSDSRCADGPSFHGPDGSPDSVWVDPADVLGPPGELGLGDAVQGSYVQYRALFERLPGSEVSSMLRAVTLRGTHSM